MPAPTPPSRRASRTTWHLRRHRVAMALMRAILRARRPRAPARRGPTKVTILLVHAWGMGGTIRTMLNVAGRLAERHEVEVVSVWRTRDDPCFAFPPGVTVTAAEDRRPGAGGAVARLLRRIPGVAALPGRPHEREHDAVDRRPARARALAGALRHPHRHAARAEPPRLAGWPRPGAGRDGARPLPALRPAAQARDPPPLCGARRGGRARRGGARGARTGHRRRDAGAHDPQRRAAAARRACAPRGPGRPRGRAAAAGQGLRPPDPRLRRGGDAASGLAATDLRERP